MIHTDENSHAFDFPGFLVFQFSDLGLILVETNYMYFEWKCHNILIFCQRNKWSNSLSNSLSLSLSLSLSPSLSLALSLSEIDECKFLCPVAVKAKRFGRASVSKDFRILKIFQKKLEHYLSVSSQEYVACLVAFFSFCLRMILLHLKGECIVQKIM